VSSNSCVLLFFVSLIDPQENKEITQLTAVRSKIVFVIHEFSSIL